MLGIDLVGRYCILSDSRVFVETLELRPGTGISWFELQAYFGKTKLCIRSGACIYRCAIIIIVIGYDQVRGIADGIIEHPVVARRREFQVRAGRNEMG